MGVTPESLHRHIADERAAEGQCIGMANAGPPRRVAEASPRKKRRHQMFVSVEGRKEKIRCRLSAS